MDGGDEDVDENSSVNWMVKKHKANTLETKYFKTMERDDGNHSWTHQTRAPLPAQIQRLREKSFTVFISNLLEQISKTELEAMCYRRKRLSTSSFLSRRAAGKGGDSPSFGFTLKEKLKRQWTLLKEDHGREGNNKRTWQGM